MKAKLECAIVVTMLTVYRNMKNEFLVALIGLLLVGCDDYPGRQSNALAKLSSFPTWVESIRLEIPVGGDCHIDSINDKPGEGSPSYTVGQSAALKVAGWGAISVKDGVTATEIAIALKPDHPDGRRLFASTTRVKRQDVADYFKNPAAIDSGFVGAIDLSDVAPGNYVLEVIQHKDGNNFKCQNTSNLTVIK